MADKKICCNCNTVNNINSKFCIECGSKNFKLPKQKLKYCYSCLIGFTEDLCPYCNEANYTNDLVGLIKHKNKLTIADNLDNYQNLVDEVKELKENINNKKEELNDLKDELNNLTSKYNNLKKKYDDNHKEKNNEISKLEGLLNSKKSIYNDLDKQMNEIVRKMGIQSISLQSKDSKLSSLEKEYKDMLDNKFDLVEKKNSLSKELEKLTKEYNLNIKTASSDVLEFESALYGCLGEKYLSKDKYKAYLCYEKALNMKNNNVLIHFIMLANEEHEEYYDKEASIKWTNYAFEYFYKKRYYTMRESLAIATIFSNPNTFHFNKEKALKFIPKSSCYLVENYYIARCYERLGMKEEALKICQKEYDSLKFSRYRDSAVDKFYLKEYESAINRIKNIK